MPALIIALLLMLSPPLLAAVPDDQAIAVAAATPRWQVLMHINDGSTLRDVGESYVDGADFFLSPDGKQSPQAELRASIQALRPAGSIGRCRFPARYRFLSEHFGWQQSEPLSHCDEYLEWREKMPIGQLVLVFPAAYLNSPSSMFGHTLLRLDDKPDPDAVWLSRSINFGAEVGDSNSIAYAWRGLIGGYPGQFSVVSYGKKIRDYGFIENRDIWEYALNLNRDELDWLVRHLWELRGINFDYFFFDENCSFRLLELIEVARPKAALTQGFRIAEMPVHTVRTLYAAGLITERRYRPSKVHELEHLTQQLKPAELALSKRLKREPGLAETAEFANYSPQRRNLMAQVAYQALRVQNRSRAREDKTARDSLALLRIVQRNPAAAAVPVTQPPAPETGHGTELLTVGAGRRGGRDYLEFGHRLTYHDIFDPVTGFLPGAGIEGLNLRLRLTESEGLDLERLDLVNIRSLAPRGDFVKPISWFVHGGLEQVLSDEARHLGLFVQGGPGASWQFGGFHPYLFGVARAEVVSTIEPGARLGGGAETGFAWYVRGLQLGASGDALEFSDGETRYSSAATINIPLTQAYALRTQCAHEVSERYGHSDSQSSCGIELRHLFD